MDSFGNQQEDDMNKMAEQIKKIREQYDFPIWLIRAALEYYNKDEDKAVERLKEIYRCIGDNPKVTIKRNIEKFMNEIQQSKGITSSENNEDLYLSKSRKSLSTVKYI